MMTPLELKRARLLVGLTVRQMAEMLETDPQTVRRMEMDPLTANTARAPAARMVRLYRCYLDGYRPADWPTTEGIERAAKAIEPELPSEDPHVAHRASETGANPRSTQGAVMTLTTKQLIAIRDGCEGVTPGPWELALEGAMRQLTDVSVAQYLMANTRARSDGFAKAHYHAALVTAYVAAVRNVGPDEVRRLYDEDFQLVHDTTAVQLTNRLDEVIGFNVNRPVDDDLAEIFFQHFHTLALHAINPPHQFDCAATRGARKASLESHASMIPTTLAKVMKDD